MKLWDQTYTKTELMRHIGDISQACGIRRCVLDDGPGRGMRAFDVDTGSGLQFTALPDRGLDISACRYRGLPLSFISKTGPVAPGLCSYGSFLRYFTAGLLTTCGYTHMGAACMDGDRALAAHGYAPALVSDNTAAEESWQGDDYLMRIRGTMREAEVFGENIRMTRELRATAGENRIRITDRVENAGFDPQPLMLLYHCNFGHPFLGPDTRLISGGRNGVVPRDEAAASGLSRCDSFEEPTHGYAEQVFYHDLVPDAGGLVWAGLRNPALGVSVKLKFFKRELPYLIEWKQMGEGDYVCGLEPATWKPEGRARARVLGELETIQPGEVREFHLEICVESE
ncbi:MAG: aldose 1-epimerase family protein [Firmicutes bacterium]|nr:aldose 1-epimerase family protein [Bacillota bacterium]